MAEKIAAREGKAVISTARKEESYFFIKKGENPQKLYEKYRWSLLAAFGAARRCPSSRYLPDRAVAGRLDPRRNPLSSPSAILFVQLLMPHGGNGR